ncbi:MAG TPA: YafY family protein [Trebonia sp.]|jgi:predicted DNA-binding transcriptional regulator YafY|nr:YafY family protein [Trebonia sp.]
MANTSSRTLRLLSLLQNHRYWPGDELAERLGVSPRTLRRDVGRLRELGYPVQAQRGVDGGYQLAAGAALPPLLVDDQEAVALAVGLQLAVQGSGAGQQGAIAEAAARALAKVTLVMPPRLRRQVEAVAAMTESATWQGAGTEAIAPEVLARIALACRDSERIRFGYTAAGGQRSARQAEPHRLVALDRRWYLVAYDLDRQDWRTFRLDRIGPVAGSAVPGGAARPPGRVPASAAVEATGVRFRARDIPGGDAAEFVRRNIRGLPAASDVVAIVEAGGGPVRKKIGQWASVTDLGPGRCEVRMTPPEDSDWPIIALGITGADFRVVSPPEVAAGVRAWAGRLARAARSGESPPGPQPA